MKILKNRQKLDFDIPKVLKISLSRPQNITVGRVTGNKTFSFFGLIKIFVLSFLSDCLFPTLVFTL